MRLNYIKVLSVLLSLSFSVASVAGVRVEGRVYDGSSNPIEGAACVAFSLPDSIYVAGTVTDAEGAFSVDARIGQSYLRISSLGFVPRDMPVSVDAKTISGTDTVCNLGTIVLDPTSTQLGEVVVKAEKPQLKMVKGVLTYDVSQMLARNAYASAHSLLLDLPLIESPDGKNIKLLGAPLGSEIYLNGRKSIMSAEQLIEYLKSVSADLIKTVEIIYMPGPQWGASGAVINVELKRHNSNYVSGRVSMFGRHYQEHYQYGGSASVIYASPKLEAQVVYNYSDGKQSYWGAMEADHKVDGVVHHIRKDYENEDTRRMSPVYASIVYTPDDDNRLELTYSGRFNPILRGEGYQTFSNQAPEATTIINDNTFNGVNLSYRYKRKIWASLLWSRTDSRLTSGYRTIYGGDTPDMVNSVVSNQTGDSYRGIVDFELPVGKGWTLMFGASATMRFADSWQRAIVEFGDFGSESYSGVIKQNQYTYTAYAGVSKSLYGDKLYIMPTVEATGTRMSDEKTFDILPSVNMTYQPHRDHIFQGKVTSWRVLPTLWQLSDYVIASNSYSLTIGNPELKQARYFEEKLTYIFKNRYVLSLSFTQGHNHMMSLDYMMPDRLALLNQAQNIRKMNYYELTLSVPFSKGIYNGSIGLEGMMIKGKTDDFYGMKINSTTFDGSVSTWHRFKILSKPYLGVTVAAGYSSRTSKLDYEYNAPSWYVTGYATLGLLDNSLFIEFTAGDIFETGSSRRRWIECDGRKVQWEFCHNQRLLSLSVSYTFKGYKERRQKNLGDSSFGIN